MSAALLHRRMPRARRITLGVILSMAFTNSVLLVVTLVRPVPQFSSSGTLMTITAKGNATLGQRDESQSQSHAQSRRGFCEDCSDEIASNTEDEEEAQGHDWLINDIGMEKEESDSSGIQPGKGTSSTEVPSEQENQSDKEENIDPEAAEDDESGSDEDGLFIILPEDDEKGTEDTAEDPTNSKARPSRTTPAATVPLYESETSEPSSSISTGTSITSSSDVIEVAFATETVVAVTAQETVKVVTVPRGFVEIWIGPLGVCNRRGNGTIACSDASMNANYLPAYEQAGLNRDIRSKLPHSLKGVPVALLLAGMVYMLCTAIFAYTLAPPFNLSTPYGPQKSMDVRHQTALAINTVLSSLALFLVLIPTFTLRGRFLKVVDTIPAFNVDLQPRMGGAFAQLYACAILGGLIVLQSMILVSEDLRHPWWVLFNTRWTNPFQTSPPGIDFTAHRQLRHQQEVREAAARARLQAMAGIQANANTYEGDGFSTYAPTRLAASEAPAPVRPATSAYMASQSHGNPLLSGYPPPSPRETMRRYTGSMAPSAAHIPLRRYTASAAPSGTARPRAASHF